MFLPFYNASIEKILAGKQLHTVRVRPKCKPRTGVPLTFAACDAIHHLTVKGFTLHSWQTVTIKINKSDPGFKLRIWIDFIEITGEALAYFVRNEGHEDSQAFADYWIQKLPRKKDRLKGYFYQKMILYHWTNLRYNPLPEPALF